MAFERIVVWVAVRKKKKKIKIMIGTALLLQHYDLQDCKMSNRILLGMLDELHLVLTERLAKKMKSSCVLQLVPVAFFYSGRYVSVREDQHLLAMLADNICDNGRLNQELAYHGGTAINYLFSGFFLLFLIVFPPLHCCYFHDFHCRV